MSSEDSVKTSQLGFAEWPNCLEERFGGDWRHPGIYLLHHIPTGLEYVGASANVAKRIRDHARGSEWLPRLRAALLVKRHGPLIAEDGDYACILHNPRQAAQLPFHELVRALSLITVKAPEVNASAEIIPVFLEPCELDANRIAETEEKHIAQRRPALNSKKAGRYSSYAISRAGARKTPSGNPPLALDNKHIEAIPSLWRLESLAMVSSIYKQNLEVASKNLFASSSK